MTAPTALTAEQIDALASKRAGAKMGWYMHAAVYLLVNLGLAALALSSGRDWHAYPLLGWGLGLAIHGACYWLNKRDPYFFDALGRHIRQKPYLDA